MSDWPDGDAPYEFPVDHDGELTRRWQEAVDQSVQSGLLRLVPSGAHGYDLVGRCPRCGHDFAQSITFLVFSPGVSDMGDIAAGLGRVAAARAVDTIRTDIVCRCTSDHQGRDPDDRRGGCGWGRTLTIWLSRPGTCR